MQEQFSALPQSQTGTQKMQEQFSAFASVTNAMPKTQEAIHVASARKIGRTRRRQHLRSELVMRHRRLEFEQEVAVLGVVLRFCHVVAGEGADRFPAVPKRHRDEMR